MGAKISSLFLVKTSSFSHAFHKRKRSFFLFWDFCDEIAMKVPLVFCMPNEIVNLILDFPRGGEPSVDWHIFMQESFSTNFLSQKHQRGKNVFWNAKQGDGEWAGNDVKISREKFYSWRILRQFFVSFNGEMSRRCFLSENFQLAKKLKKFPNQLDPFLNYSNVSTRRESCFIRAEIEQEMRTQTAKII